MRSPFQLSPFSTGTSRTSVPVASNVGRTPPERSRDFRGITTTSRNDFAAQGGNTEDTRKRKWAALLDVVAQEYEKEIGVGSIDHHRLQRRTRGQTPYGSQNEDDSTSTSMTIDGSSGEGVSDDNSLTSLSDLEDVVEMGSSRNRGSQQQPMVIPTPTKRIIYNDYEDLDDYESPSTIDSGSEYQPSIISNCTNSPPRSAKRKGKGTKKTGKRPAVNTARFLSTATQQRNTRK